VKSGLHQFFVWVLLVLLPLQATAVATVCPHSTLTAAASDSASPTMDEDCGHGPAGNVSQDADDSKEPQQSDQTEESCCATMTACSMCSIAVSMQQAPNIDRTQKVSSTFLSSQYTSFIPEGLQRPPIIPA